MDPRTGTYALVGGEDYRRSRLDSNLGARTFPGAVCVNRRRERLNSAGSRRAGEGDARWRPASVAQRRRAEEVRSGITGRVRQRASHRGPDQRPERPG